MQASLTHSNLATSFTLLWQHLSQTQRDATQNKEEVTFNRRNAFVVTQMNVSKNYISLHFNKIILAMII